MKKGIAMFMALTVAAGLLVGCGSNSNSGSGEGSNSSSTAAEAASTPKRLLRRLQRRRVRAKERTAPQRRRGRLM